MVDATLRTEEPGWHARIEGERDLEPGRPGTATATAYTIGLMHAGERHVVDVCAYLADDLTDAARQDRSYQRQAVLRQVFSQLEAGWTPQDATLPSLRIGNPGPGYHHAPGPRASFITRLLGRSEPI